MLDQYGYVPVTFVIEDETGVPLELAPSGVLSVKNEWTGGFVDFSQTPPIDVDYPAMPIVTMGYAVNMGNIHVPGPQEAWTEVFTVTVDGPGIVVSSGGVPIPSGETTWTYEERITVPPPMNSHLLGLGSLVQQVNVYCAVPNEGIDISFTYIDTTMLEYGFPVSGLSDGRYTTAVSYGTYRALGDFSVANGALLPEGLSGNRGTFFLDISATDASGNALNGGTVSLFWANNDAFLTSKQIAPDSNTASFFVPSGDMYASCYVPGYLFNIQELTLSGDMSIAMSGTLVFEQTVQPSDVCMVYGNILDLGGDPASGVSITFRTSHNSTTGDGDFITKYPVEAFTTSGGFFQIPLLGGVDVIAQSDDALKRVEFTVPMAASAALSDLING